MVNRLLLKEIAKITTGSSAPKEKYFSNNGLPFIRAGHLEALIESNKINELPKIDEETGKKLKLKKVGKGTILFAKSGMSSKKNRVYICTDNAYIVSHLAAIIPNSNLVNNSYLKYYLEWYKPSRLIIDESYPSIRTTDIGNIEINLPSLESQLRIVKILDQVRSLIKKRKAQIEALDQLTQSVFLEMFGDTVNNPMNWKTFRLDDVYEIIDGDRGKHYPKQNEFYDEGYCLFLNTGNVTKNGFNFDKTQFITQEKDEVLRKGKLERYDLVLTTRGTIGNIAYYDDKVPYDNIRINSGMVILRKKVNISPIFFTYYFRNPSVYKRLISGTAQPQMPISNLRKAKLYYPPLNLQNKFGDLALNIESKKNQMKKSLKVLEDNFNSLMQRAFKGELFTKEKVSNL